MAGYEKNTPIIQTFYFGFLIREKITNRFPQVTAQVLKTYGRKTKYRSTGIAHITTFTLHSKLTIFQI